MRKEASRSRPLVAALVLAVLTAGFAGGFYAMRQSATPPSPSPPPARSELTGRDIALRSFASVVSIATKKPSGRPLSLGSGFVVEHGIVATNFHVVRGAGSGAVRLVGDSEWHSISGVVASDDDLDLVLLAVPSLEAAPLPIGDNEKVAIGDEIFVVSNPQDLEGTFTTGIVSGKRKLDGTRLLQISAPISGGSSGGPVLDREAHVVAVATSSLRDGQNLNFAITADHLQSLVAARGPPQDLAKVARPKRIEVARATPQPTFFGRLRRMFGFR
jgi:S1-C subfamily serine protease